MYIYIYIYTYIHIYMYTYIYTHTYTQIFVGSVYQGTEFQLSALNAITTDGANPSVLTVETEDPTNFSVDTSFFLSNSLGSKAISVNAANVEPNNHRTKQESFTHYYSKI